MGGHRVKTVGETFSPKNRSRKKKEGQTLKRSGTIVFVTVFTRMRVKGGDDVT